MTGTVFEQVQHRCKFSDQGCEVKMILKDLVTHEKQCPVNTPSRTPSAYDRPGPSHDRRAEPPSRMRSVSSRRPVLVSLASVSCVLLVLITLGGRGGPSLALSGSTHTFSYCIIGGLVTRGWDGGWVRGRGGGLGLGPGLGL